MARAGAMRHQGSPARVLVIAGTDPGGGAGLGADLRTAAALGCHALLAVTAITVQDSRAVRRVAPVSPRLVREQIEAALDDAGADAVKVGMLGSAGVARAVAAALEHRRGLGVVLDPVLRATVGTDLIDERGRGVLLRRLLPLATIVTPNLAEAGALLGRTVRGLAGMASAAEGLLAAGARAALVTGGHLAGDPVDLYSDGVRTIRLRGPRMRTRNTHGSGCVLSTAIACYLARRASPAEAVRLGKRFVTAAIRGSYALGKGAGPVNPLAVALAATALAALLPRGAGGAGSPAADAPGLDAPETVRQGDLFLVRAPGAGAAPRSVEFLGHRYPPLSAGPGDPVFLLGVDLDAEPGPGEILLVTEGGGTVRASVAVERGRYPEEHLSLPTAMVTPPPEVEERIVREQALTAAVYASSAPAQLWTGGFAPPLDAPTSGNFGKRRVLNGKPRSPHGGQDYAAAAGTPVRAIAAGRVRLAQELYYSGNTVLIDHGGGLVSQYLHLEKLLVAEGGEVAGGETVGLVGSTGRATGPHLHYGLRLFGQRVDPERIFRLLPRR